MEGNSNNSQYDYFPRNKIISANNSLISREEFKNMNEEHILSLRKKKGNRQLEQIKKFSLTQQNTNHGVDIKKLISLIQNEALYLKYNSNEKETDKLNYLLQMLLSENINVLKYGLIELKTYINNINDSNEFLSKNLLNEFNEKMLRFLINLLFKNKSEYLSLEDYYQIMTLLCFIISKLCTFNDFYIGILFEYLQNLLNLAQNEPDKNLMNSIYIIANKIIIKGNKKLEQIYPNLFNQVYNELIQLINESMKNKNIFILKELFPNLMNIINIIIFTNIQSFNNNISLFESKKLCNLLSLVKQFLDKSFMETEILKSSLYFLSTILKFYKKGNIQKDSVNKFIQLINSIRLDKHIISYIFDNSKDNNDFRYEIIEIINNMLVLNDSDFLNSLIENNICEQISNLQYYLLDDNKENNNIINMLYKSHIDLIYNLISTQSVNAIQNICIENSCISNLFKFINNTSFLYNNDNLKIIEIFDLIIQSKTEFVHSLLLSEGIYELYINILNNSKDNNILLIILKDFSIMIERGKSIKTSKGINIVARHFMKNGILDLINNIKSRMDLNNQITFLLDEIPKLLEEKTI